MNLQIKNISKTYQNKQILDKINYTFSKGIYGILGANGMGKTTLLTIISGSLTSDSGEVLYNGVNIKNDIENYFNVIGFLPQVFSYYSEFTGEEFLRFMCLLKGISPKNLKVECDRLLQQMGLVDVRHKKVLKYSGGMKQRLGIAQALIGNPQILILDEPMVGLDPKERVKFRNLLHQLSKEKIILLSTHIVSDLEYFADKILILKNGQFVESNTTEALLNKFNHKIWRVNLATDELKDLLILNQEGPIDGGAARVFSLNRPTAAAIALQPTLEDIYLYYFSEGWIQ